LAADFEDFLVPRPDMLPVKRSVSKKSKGIWLVSFMNYDLGYVDPEERTLQPLDNPFGPKVLPM
jgi:hypothetical protein